MRVVAKVAINDSKGIRRILCTRKVDIKPKIFATRVIKTKSMILSKF